MVVSATPQQTVVGAFPRPVSGTPAIVATGEEHGENWTVVAYITKLPAFRIRGRVRGGDALCLSEIDGSRSNAPSESVCGGLRGMKGLRSGAHGGWGTWFDRGYGPAPTTIFGAAAAGVARVEVTLNPDSNGRTRTITPRLTSAPGIGGGIHFFVVHYPRQIGFKSVTLLDSHGRILKRQP